MMDFFSAGNKNTAVVRSVVLKKKKLKQSPESSFEKQMAFRLDIEITKEIKKGLDPRIVALLDSVENGAEGEVSLPINAIDLVEEYEANMAFFGEGNFKETARPKIALGHKTGSPVKVRLTRIAIIDKVPYLLLQCKTDYVEEFWNLIPSFFESEMVVSMVPFQGELFEDDKKEAEEPEETEAEVVPIKEAMGKGKKKEKEERVGKKYNAAGVEVP